MKHAYLSGLTLSALLTLCASTTFGETTINVPDDYATIPAAIEAAQDGDTIVLADNTYLLTEQLTITNAITLTGSSAEKCILKRTQKGAEIRVLKLNSAGARVENVTITGGYSWENWKCGMGVLIDSNGGTVSHCIISNNVQTAGYHKGAGVYMKSGRLEYCKVINNPGGVRNSSYGGGVACIGASSKATMPVIDSCLIAGNSANEAGGGVYVSNYAAILNTTIAGNTTSGSTGGGGLYVATENFWMTNCIIAANTANSDAGTGKPNWATSQKLTKFTNKIGYCLYGDTSAVIGNETSCKTGNPAFKKASEKDYHITALSDAVGKAYAAMSGTTDLDGIERDEAPDIGCYEYDAASEPFSCIASFSPKATLKDQPITLSFSLVNPPTGIDPVYTWRFIHSPSGETNVYANGEQQVTLNRAGLWAVSLVVSDRNSTKKTDEYVCEDKLLTGSFTNYVTAAANENASFPYDTPETAATSLNDLQNWIVDGTVICLDAGTHVLAKTFEAKGAYHVIGVGRDGTVLTLPTGKHGRLCYMNHPDALIEDLTFRGGLPNDNWVSGVSVCIGSLGGTLRRCCVTGAMTDHTYCYGALSIESAQALVENTIIEANTNQNDNCCGAGLNVSEGTIRSCLVKDNVSLNGARYAVQISRNANVENLTVVGNSDVHTDSAAFYISSTGSGGHVRNCVFADNRVGEPRQGDSETLGQPNWALGSADAKSLVDHCCWVGSKDLGTDCADATKVNFVDAANGDYRILRGSSCWNTGRDAAWMEDAKDLGGNDRVVGPHVDMGCFECQTEWGMMLLLQ